MASGDAPKQNPDNPISENNTAENRNNATLKILLAEIQVIESAIHAYQAQQNENARHERKKFWIQLLTLAAVVIYAGLTLLIWREMVGTGRQTEKLIQEAIKQSKAAQDSADAAKKAIEVTQENIRLEQRAWVGAIEVRNIAVKAGAKTQFTVVITNTGRTPALKLVTHTATGAFPSDQVFVPKYQTLKTKPGVSVLQPGARLFLNVRSIGELTDTHIDSLKKSTHILYVFGRLTYEDIFKQPHYTIFCMRIAPNLTDAYSCDTHNDAN